MDNTTEVRFIVKEAANGNSFLVAEPMSGTPANTIALYFKAGTTISQVEEIALALNERLARIAIT